MAVELHETDRQAYRELRDFLPPRIFDAHIHLFDRSCLMPGAAFPPTHFCQKFGGVFTLEECLAWAAASLPEQEYHLNSFGDPSRQSDLDASAAYTGRISDNQRSFGMALVSPQDPVESVIRRVEDNRLIGYKPYLNFVTGKPAADITIDDMLPAAQMEAADARGLAITLHIPRPGRLADPLNQQQMVAICRRYPRTKIIFAHIGRAYFLANVVGFLDGIAACPNAFLDTAMVNHEGVLAYAFRHFPRERILFGSDAPVAFLRGKSVEINNQYAYLMGEPYDIGTALHDPRNLIRFTTFFFEQLRGIRLAAQQAGLSRSEVENLFFDNASRLFSEIATRLHGHRKNPS